jgi:hypothetical protein
LSAVNTLLKPVTDLASYLHITTTSSKFDPSHDDEPAEKLPTPVAGGALAIAAK